MANSNRFIKDIIKQRVAYAPFDNDFSDVELEIRQEVSRRLKEKQISIQSSSEKDELFPFTSDTGSSMSPEVAIQRVVANEVLRLTGSNSFLEQERAAIAGLFKNDSSPNPIVFFASSTSQANRLATSAVADVQPNKGDLVIASSHSHIFSFEVGQPAEMITPKDKETGKLVIEDLEQAVAKYKTIKRNIKLIHLDQPTKGDYFYSPEEIKKITSWSHNNNIAVSMDCERLVGYLANTGTNYDYYTSKCGVDIVTLGMQKNGGARSSSAVVLNTEYLRNKKDLVRRVESYQYSIGNVTDAPIAVATGWNEMVSNELYIQNAKRANEKADRIADTLYSFDFDGERVEIQNYPLTTNMIFAKLPREFVDQFNSAEDGLYLRPDRYGTTRIVTAFDTGDKDVDRFIEKLNKTYAKLTGKVVSLNNKQQEQASETKDAITAKEVLIEIRKIVEDVVSEKLGADLPAHLKMKSEIPQQDFAAVNILENAMSYHSPYGNDRITEEAKDSIMRLFGREKGDGSAVVFTASRNQASNSALNLVASVNGPTAALVSEDSRLYHLAHNRSVKFMSLEGEYKETGKLNPKVVDGLLKFHNTERGMHVPLISSVVIEQPTRTGYVYTKEEIREITNIAHAHNTPVVMFPHRLSYHLAQTNQSYSDYTDLGIDVVTIGLRALGGADNSAVVVLNSEYLAIRDEEVEMTLNRIVKGSGGKQSGAAYGNIGWKEILDNDKWRDIVTGISEKAEKLKDALEEIGIKVDRNGKAENSIVTFEMDSSLATSEIIRKYKPREAESGIYTIKITHNVTEDDIEKIKRDFQKAISNGADKYRKQGSVDRNSDNHHKAR